MTYRERFFAVMENRPVDRVPFLPNITDWYNARRTPRGERQRYSTGQFIFDDDPFHKNPGDMPERFRDFTLFDFYLPLLPDAGFDLLDGCTPAPMGNYEPEDLATVPGSNLKAYCGVPSTLFCTGAPTEEIIAYARRIEQSLAPNVILNVGDVLPPNGDIDQAIALNRGLSPIMR